MYNFSYFKEKDQQAILDFIEAHPLAFLTGSTLLGEQVATQIPVILEERNGELYLQGHLMRNTDHHKAFVENPNALLVEQQPGKWNSLGLVKFVLTTHTVSTFTTHHHEVCSIIHLEVILTGVCTVNIHKNWQKRLTVSVEKNQSQAKFLIV